MQLKSLSSNFPKASILWSTTCAIVVAISFSACGRKNEAIVGTWAHRDAKTGVVDHIIEVKSGYPQYWDYNSDVDSDRDYYDVTSVNTVYSNELLDDRETYLALPRVKVRGAIIDLNYALIWSDSSGVWRIRVPDDENQVGVKVSDLYRQEKIPGPWNLRQKTTASEEKSERLQVIDEIRDIQEELEFVDVKLVNQTKELRIEYSYSKEGTIPAQTYVRVESGADQTQLMTEAESKIVELEKNEDRLAFERIQPISDHNPEEIYIDALEFFSKPELDIESDKIESIARAFQAHRRDHPSENKYYEFRLILNNKIRENSKLLDINRESLYSLVTKSLDSMGNPGWARMISKR